MSIALRTPSKAVPTEDEFVQGAKPAPKPVGKMSKMRGVRQIGRKVQGQVTCYLDEADFVKLKLYCVRNGLNMSTVLLDQVKPFLDGLPEG